MRRRSERRKSTEVAPSAPVSRRSNRRSRKSTEGDKNSNQAAIEKNAANPAESEVGNTTTTTVGGDGGGGVVVPPVSDEEQRTMEGVRKIRATRTRTPVNENSRRKSQRMPSPDPKIAAIPEEKNGSFIKAVVPEEGATDNEKPEEPPAPETIEEEAVEEAVVVVVPPSPEKTEVAPEPEKDEQVEMEAEEETVVAQEEEAVVEQEEEEVVEAASPSAETASPKAGQKTKVDANDVSVEQTPEMAAPSPEADSAAAAVEKPNESPPPADEAETGAENETPANEPAAMDEEPPKKEAPPAAEEKEEKKEEEKMEQKKKKPKVAKPTAKDDAVENDGGGAAKAEAAAPADVADAKDADRTPSPTPLESPSKNHAEPNAKANKNTTPRVRKRKWLSKKVGGDTGAPIVSISTDSLKLLIADVVEPVPLSDVKLDSSPEVQELINSEREEGEESPSPVVSDERRRSLTDKTNRMEKSDRTAKPIDQPIKVGRSHDNLIITTEQAIVDMTSLHRTPSPARNQVSSVLYITNLVRPFTLIQLKGLLARTGKIVEADGFWIDRIKSKCYVQYETEDEAVETRHALHGVRWPVSNPKCLQVDFGSRADMERAIELTKDEPPRFGQDHNKDNLLVGTGWSMERRDLLSDKRIVRHVREWDVGKQDAATKEIIREPELQQKQRSKERDLPAAGAREADKSDKEKQRDKSSRSRARDRDRERSNSASPARKLKKKENDPPLRLLDDLFRKTKTTPCIYWLPLTPEQITEKEALRQRRMERVKEREVERTKDREKERQRTIERVRVRERDNKRPRSGERRRSHSRDRRRY